MKDIFIYNGIEDKFERAEYTIQHESGWVWNANNGISKGLAMFTRPTWNQFCRGLGEYDDMNPHSNLLCFTKLWKMNQEWRWDVYCDKYYNLECIERRGLYQGFLKK